MSHLYRSILHIITRTSNTELVKISKEDVERGRGNAWKFMTEIRYAMWLAGTFFVSVHQWITWFLVGHPCFCCFALQFCQRPSVNYPISCRTPLFLLFCTAIPAPSISELLDFLSDTPVSVVLHCNSVSVHQRIAWFLVGHCFVLIAKILPVQTRQDLCVVQGTGAGKYASQLLKASCASYANGLPLAAKVHWTVCLSLAMQ